MAGDSCPSLVVCVLGLSRAKGERFSRQSGIGKSCLCYRFMHPGHDDYIDEHSSLLALHEFENPVINSVHFLYWGSTTKRYPIHGGPKEQRIQFHVIEQTVFYQDVTSKPFKSLTKPDNLEYYIRRVTTHIESPGKVSYKSRDTIALRQEYVWQAYPMGISGLPRGYIVVIDVSQNGADFDRQIARAERIMEYFLKHKRKFVIVATKRDVFVPASMNKVQRLKRKYETQVFATSASANLNISDAFRFIACKVLRKDVRGVSDCIVTYEEAARQLLYQKVGARRIFRNYLQKMVVNSDERVNVLENTEEYKDCIHVLGKFEADMHFADHLIEVHSEKMKSYAVVQENPQLLLEFLEDFVDQRTDLALYSQRLRRWIRSYFEDHPQVPAPSEAEARSLSVERRQVAGVSRPVKEVNQVLADPSNPDSDDYDDINTYVNYPLPRPPTEKPGPTANYGGGQVGSEIQEPSGILQDYTSPTPGSKPPQVGPESTVLSADEPEVQVGIRQDMGDMDKEEGSSGAVLSLTTEAPRSSPMMLSPICSSLESVMQKSDNVGKEEKRITLPGNSDIRRHDAEHLKKLLIGEEAGLEPAVAAAHLNKSPESPPVNSLGKHSQVHSSFKPSSAQLIKKDSDTTGKEEKHITPPGSNDIKRRAEHLKKLLSGKGEDLNPTVADASLNISSPSVASLTKEALLQGRFDTSFKPSFPQLVKQDSDGVGKEGMPPGSSETKRCAEHLTKLLSEEEEVLEPSVAELPPNKSSLPRRIDGKQKQSPLPGTRKPVRQAPKLPGSPKSAQNDSLKERRVTPASPIKLHGEQINKPQLSQLFQLPPSPLQPSPITGPPIAQQAPKQNPVTHVNGSISEKEMYMPRLPTIKRRIEQKRLEEQQKKKGEAFIAESPITGTPLSPDIPRPPRHSRHQAPSYPAPPPPKGSLPSSHPSHVLPLPEQTMPSPPPNQMVLPPSLPQTQMDPSLPPLPLKRMQSINRSLPVSNKQTDYLPSSYSSAEDPQPAVLQQSSDMLQTPPEDSSSSICPQVARMKADIKKLGQKCKWFYQYEGRPCSTMTTTALKPSDSANMKERPLPAEPFAVDFEDNELDHNYELMDFEPLLAQCVNLSTFTTHHKSAPLSAVPVGFRSDSAGKDEMAPCSSDIKRRAEHPKKVLSREGEELEPSVAETSLKNSSPTATQNSKQKQSLKTSKPGTRKPVRPAPKPPVRQKSTKDGSPEKRPMKRASPSRLQGENVHNAQFPQLSQRPPSLLQPSPITSPPPTYQVPKQSLMSCANGNISGTEVCVTRFSILKRNMEENCLHVEQPKEEEEPFIKTKSSKAPRNTLALDHSLPDQPLRYQPPSYPAPPPPEDAVSAEPLHCSPPVLPPPEQMKVPPPFPQPALPSPVPDKALHYLPMSSTEDDSYVNWETIDSVGTRFPILKRNMEENCLHVEQPKEEEEPFIAKSSEAPRNTIALDHSLPDQPLRYQPPSYTAPEDAVSAEPLHCSPPVLPPPEQMKVPPPFPQPAPVPDKVLDYLPVSSTEDDSYVNWGTIDSIGSWYSAIESPLPNQPPTVPMKSNPSRFSLDDPTVYENLPVPDKSLPMISAVDDSYENWETIGSTDSQFSTGGSQGPIAIQPPPVSTKTKPNRFSLDDYVNLDKSHDYIQMSCAVDDSYVNCESPLPSQHPSVPTNSKPHMFSSDDLTDYVNLPNPDKQLVLLPRRLERQQQLTLESVQERSPRPISSPRMPQSTSETSSSKRPTPLPRTSAPKTSVLELMTPYTSCTPEELIGPPATSSSRCNPLPNLQHIGLTNHPDQADETSSLPPRSILRPVGCFHGKDQVESRLVESAFSCDGVVAANTMGTTTGTPTRTALPGRDLANKVLYEKQSSDC